MPTGVRAGLTLVAGTRPFTAPEDGDMTADDPGVPPDSLASMTGGRMAGAGGAGAALVAGAGAAGVAVSESARPSCACSCAFAAAATARSFSR